MCVGIEPGELIRHSEIETWRLEEEAKRLSDQCREVTVSEVAAQTQYDIGFPDGVGYGSDGQSACEKKRAPHDKVRFEFVRVTCRGRFVRVVRWRRLTIRCNCRTWPSFISVLFEFAMSTDL